MRHYYRLGSPKAVNLEILDTTLNDQSMPSLLLDPSTIWVTFERSVLYASDKLLIENGKELNDKHIHYAQSMIKKQFPSVGGLCSTLFQNKLPSKSYTSANTIQIVHCKRRKHWITISTKWCKNNWVAVYDSLFKRLDVETRNTIMKMFGLKKSNERIMMPMQKQEGCKDCGPFSIAVMTSLEDDPSEIRYKQLDLRQHLIHCFANGELVCFPKE